jgi:hypothetical protein
MAGALIDGAASYTLSAQWKYAEVVSDIPRCPPCKAKKGYGLLTHLR